MKCWEFMKCGRQRGGPRVAELGECPAWAAGGTDCARVAGTLCMGRVQGTFAAKLADCLRCSFYHSGHYRRSRPASSSCPGDRASASD